MTKDLSVTVMTLDGEPVQQDSKPVSMGTMIKNALLMQSENQKLSGPDKFKHYELAKKIKDHEAKCELKSEEVTLIKQVVGEFYFPTVVGFIYTELEK